MKKIRFMAMLLAAGALVACNETLEQPGIDDETPTTGEGYVKVAINLPSTSGALTKAEPSFDNGMEKEYDVKNCIIVFFEGKDESSAVFKKAYTVTLPAGTEGNQQVTSRHLCLTQAPLAAEDNKTYALAILNNCELYSVAGNGDLLSTNDNPVFTNAAATFSVLKDAINGDADDYSSDKGFLMLNSPLAVKKNENDYSVQTLVPVTVYETEAEAAGNDAANIYVERVVAKVTLKGFALNDPPKEIGTTSYKYTKEVESDGSAFNGNLVGFEGWTLNVTNKTFKPIREVASELREWITLNSEVKYVSSTSIETDTDGNDYRIYWAIDNNYSSDDNYTPNEAFNTYTTETLDDDDFMSDTDDDKSNGSTVSHPLYCLENTMYFNRQNKDQTTSIIIKAKYFLTEESADGTTSPVEESFFMYGGVAKTYTENDFLDVVKTATNIDELIINPNAVGGTYDNAETGRTMSDLFKIDNTTDLTGEQATEIWNKIGTIKYYKNGDSYYYTTLIKHFGDDTNYDPSKGYRPSDLGRYGVVRNNWYEINITSISGPGEPEVEEPDDNPDDETEGYMRAQINVLSWAKRSQEVDL